MQVRGRTRREHRRRHAHRGHQDDQGPDRRRRRQESGALDHPVLPGRDRHRRLSGQLLPFPDSTVDATTIVVQDPSTLPDPNDWYDAFNPQAVIATPVPACSTLSVQYTTDDGRHLDVQSRAWSRSTAPPSSTRPSRTTSRLRPIGIRFVYTADPAGGACSGGFPPGTSVSPNLSYSLDEDVPNDSRSDHQLRGDVGDQPDRAGRRRPPRPATTSTSPRWTPAPSTRSTRPGTWTAW